MNQIEKMELDNRRIVNNLTELARTEDSRSSISTAVYLRLNNELRLKNVQDIRKDISYGAKYYGQTPEKYTTAQDSIVRSYVEQINKFMKMYNEAFVNIQTVEHNAATNQKNLVFKARKLDIVKQIYQFCNRPESDYANYENKIKEYKDEIEKYEQVIKRCDEEYTLCRNRREEEFKEIFNISPSQMSVALIPVEKDNFIKKFFKKLWTKTTNKFNGYQNFQKDVLQRHATNINGLKTGGIDKYLTKIKQDMVTFNYEVDTILGEV